MAERVHLRIDGVDHAVPAGLSVAAALNLAGRAHHRRSLTGERRAPLCGIGQCYECRLSIDGRPHQRGCQRLVTEGMDIATDA